LAIAACTPQPGATSGANAPASGPGVPAASGAGNQPVANPAATPAQTSGGSGGALQDFLGFAGRTSLKYMVVYNLVSSGSQAFSGTMTQYIMVSGAQTKMRVDTAMQGQQTRMVYDGTTANSCANVNGAWNCYTIQYQADTAQKTRDDIKNNPSKYTVTALPDKTIAGVTAKCFESTNSGSTVDYCYSSEGVPLYIKTVASGMTTEMTATSFSTSVSDSDFALPAGATTQNLNDLMKKIPQVPTQ